jgi:hypothetical protein
MIYIRDDDVLMPSSGIQDPFKKFRRIQNWLKEVPQHFMHVPAILVTEIQQFPKCIDFVREETKEGRMEPELHGYEHIDYGRLTLNEVKNHLEMSLEWMKEEFEVVPKKWYTPWGGHNGTMEEAAHSFNLEMVTTANIVRPSNFLDMIKKHGPILDQDVEIFMHWWNRGLRLRKITGIYKCGSYKNALEQDDKAVWG